MTLYLQHVVPTRRASYWTACAEGFDAIGVGSSEREAVGDLIHLMADGNPDLVVIQVDPPVVYPYRSAGDAEKGGA